jgi:hypothetical protein
VITNDNCGAIETKMRPPEYQARPVIHQNTCPGDAPEAKIKETQERMQADVFKLHGIMRWMRLKKSACLKDCDRPRSSAKVNVYCAQEKAFVLRHQIIAHFLLALSTFVQFQQL